MRMTSFERDDMPGRHKDILVLAHRLHARSIPHELSMSAYNGWCIEIYGLENKPFKDRKFILIQDDSSKKNYSSDIECMTEKENEYVTEILDDDECFKRIEQWWKNESCKNDA